ncbi:DCC1-like thiol-disulfide oxidoreductase family protein [Aquirufa sp. KTFRIE-69F]|uniref:DCC1-like thiol-disulfide oxidoreductase family protein n=1 Tax=Aquirufa originis TaxID=3096514 RepID=A0ABW6D7P8_9BACT
MDGIVLIDGNCRFCRFSSKLLKRMVAGELPIIPETSFTEFTLPDIDSIKWVVGHNVYVKSDALSRILVNAHWYFQPLRLVFLLPASLLDKGYDWVAQNRLFWGKSVDDCAI